MNYLSVNTESYFDERYEQELTHVISYVTKDLKHVSWNTLLLLRKYCSTSNTETVTQLWYLHCTIVWDFMNWGVCNYVYLHGWISVYIIYLIFKGQSVTCIFAPWLYSNSSISILTDQADVSRNKIQIYKKIS
jgi:hypothetical protein